MTMQKNLAAFLLSAIPFLLFTGCDAAVPMTEDEDRFKATYEMTDITVQNPYIGFAVDATSQTAPTDHSLVYIDITFAELQPDSPEEFDFTSIAEENHLELWKSHGKHAVLRFICDLPGSKAHMDIPQWLYDLTGDGDFYDISYGKGYSPDYTNEVFMHYHQKAIAALGEYFSDEFVCYVELGSLGHWGEWHVLYSKGIKKLPDSQIREQYVRHYMDAFPNAKLLMRRPFEPAAEYGFGLYNDMTGHAKSTYEWLDWIKNGGEFTQTDEPDALVSMPDFWKTAPVGGEFTSSLPMAYMCGIGLPQTLTLLKESHTSFLGPKCPVSSGAKYDGLLYRFAVPKILNSLGYRIGITQVALVPHSNGHGYTLELQWENDGCAPIYFETPVKLYLIDDSSNIEEIADVQIDLTALLPDESVTSSTFLSADLSYTHKTLAIGILDPMTGKPSVSLASNQKQTESLLFELYKFP